MRADQLLVHRGLASTRAQAQRLIASGVQWLKLGHHHTAQGAMTGAVIGAEIGAANSSGSALSSSLYWQRVAKNGDILPDDAQIELLNDAEARYVSRGGLKLEGALKQLGLSVQGSTCLDVGQSTGGFTDCLLQLGAARVVGVDVGFGQLHDKLRSDERVLCFERVNAREPGVIAAEIAKLLAGEDEEEEKDDDFDSEFDDDSYGEAEFTPKNIATQATNTPASALNSEVNYDIFEPAFVADFDFIVGDLSFISQTIVLPAIAPLLKPNGCLVMLVKPQFELNFGQVGKGGIVREAALYEQVEKRVREAYAEEGLTVHAWLESPIQGGDGNREFFIHASKTAEAIIKEVEVKRKAATKAKAEPKADTKTK